MSTNQLIYAISEHNADLRYLTNFLAADAFVYLKLKGKSYLLLYDLEVDRGRRQASVDGVLAISDLQTEYKRRHKKPGTVADLIAMVCGNRGVKKLQVPASFPIGMAMQLNQLGLTLLPQPEPFAKARLVKKKWELAEIARVQTANQKAMAAAYNLLREADIRHKDQSLFIGSQPLTAEYVRQAIDLVLLKENCLVLNTIVACGAQTADPHERGSGPLFAGQSIVVDIFPSSRTSGYFGDMTRTFCKGKAPDKLKRLYDTVHHGQALALKHVCAGVDPKVPDRKVRDYFAKAGYPTKKQAGHMVGFFHGTGHALGLQIHEPPYMSPRGQGLLKAGMVITVEPGLYYPWGSVRIEDLVVVTKTGLRNLTSFPKVLEL